jgi:hypothetical protein
LPENDEARIEKAIYRIKKDPSIGNQELIQIMLSAKGFLIVPDPGEPNQFATVRHPESGEELLVCYTSENFVKAAFGKTGVTASHVTYGPLLDVFMECKGDLGIILNPATDAMIAISAGLAKATRDVAAATRKK